MLTVFLAYCFDQDLSIIVSSRRSAEELVLVPGPPGVVQRRSFILPDWALDDVVDVEVNCTCLCTCPCVWTVHVHAHVRAHAHADTYGDAARTCPFVLW